MGEPGRLRRALHRLAVDDDELRSEQLRRDSQVVGACALADAVVGEPIVVAGTVRAVVLRPLAGIPTLEADLDDGTGSLTLVWLGRRRIRGIDPGRALIVRGRLTRRSGALTVFNPAYELRSDG